MKASTLLLFALAACGPEETSDGIPSADGAPHLTLDPLLLDFGPVAVTDAAEHALEVTIGNTGDGDLHILNLEIEDPDAPFSLTGIGSVLVPPGGSGRFEVVFDPVTAEVSNSHVIIASDDPENPAVSLFVGGEGLAPVLSVEPAALDFGTLILGCSASAKLTLANLGSVEITVDSASLHADSAEISFAGLPEEPLVLAPSTGVALDLTYHPADEVPDSATLTLISSDPWDFEQRVPIRGAGRAAGTVTDSFEQPGERPTDVFVAVDMRAVAHAPDIPTRLEAFVDEALKLGDDVHIAIFTTDDGCLQTDPRWIDHDTEDVPGTIAAMLTTNAGDGNQHRAFMLLEAALAETGRGGCQYGMLREGSRLMLAGVSDEAEQSLAPWSFYVSLFQEYAPDVMISAVGGPSPDGCADADPYTGMIEACAATRGLLLSLCDPAWGEDLAPLAITRGYARGAFPLSTEPIPDTIEVRVDGVTAEHWTYEAGANSVVFGPREIPTASDTVEVVYTPMGACVE